jgi:hypothetical protein
MNQFVNAVQNQNTRTQNGMKARVGTSNPAVDLFFKFGASRGKNIIPDFTAAYVDNKELALRIALWGRDARGGAGERQLYRDILKGLPTDEAIALIDKTVLVGRWDDLLVDFDSDEARHYAYNKIREALEKGDGLAAKWMPRKGPVAARLRSHFGWTPKFYRKRLVELTKVVETQMCANKWDEIEFSHVPSLAASRYKKAFNRHSVKFEEYVKKLSEGAEDVKVNAGAVYPYDILKTVFAGNGWSFSLKTMNKTEKDHILAQWKALPNYVGDANILPIVDVSGSMGSPVGTNSNLRAIDVAVSLGLYLADKNKGAFHDTYLEFSGESRLRILKGDLLDKVNQMVDTHWGMNTNLHAAFENILSTAVAGEVSQEDMPKIVLIMSDMQFDYCARFDDSAIEMIRRKYESAGYEMPGVVFWNLNAHDNVPVKHNENGVALVSGFSPSIVKSVLSTDMDQFTPEGIMMKTVMVDRYAVDI